MTIGIIGAMDEEIAFLERQIKQKQEKTIANKRFIYGLLENKPIVLLQSGIGKVNAAMAASILHEQFQPNYVINTGSAGGFLENLHVGDVVISTEVVHHDVDATAFHYEYGQIPQMPLSFSANEQLIDQTIDTLKKLNIPYAKGLIASGDTFMADEEHIKFVRRKFPAMIAAEMEAAAIAQVCYEYDTPFVVIRALSDIAGKQSAVTFDEFLQLAAKNSTQIIIELIRRQKKS